MKVANIASLLQDPGCFSYSSTLWRRIYAGDEFFVSGFFMSGWDRASRSELAQIVGSDREHRHPTRCFYVLADRPDISRKSAWVPNVGAGDRSWEIALSWDTWVVTALWARSACSRTKGEGAYAPSQSITTIKNEAAPWREAASAVSSTWETLTFTSSPWEAME